MIINFHVQNFGSIRDKQTLSFEADKSTHLEDYYIIRTSNNLRLLKMAMIYGSNASGKSTVINSLSFLRHLATEPLEKKTDELKFNPFLFDQKTPKQNSNLSIEFIQKNIRYLYSVEFNKQAIINEALYCYKPNKALVYKRTTDLTAELTKISFGIKFKPDKTSKKTLEANTLWNNTVIGGFLKTNINHTVLKEVAYWFNSYLHRLIKSNTNLQHYISKRLDNSQIKKENIISILQKADFNITDLLLETNKEVMIGSNKILKAAGLPNNLIVEILKNPAKKVIFEHKVDNNAYYLPIEFESEGTKRYFEIAGLLCMLIQESRGLLIDELDSSLHPDLYLHFLLSFLTNSHNSQLIATTHNREILNNKDVFRNDAIWFTDKSTTCATELYSLVDFDSSVIRDTTNILNAYKSGKLRGVPNLSDYYIDLQK